MVLPAQLIQLLLNTLRNLRIRRGQVAVLLTPLTQKISVDTQLTSRLSCRVTLVLNERAGIPTIIVAVTATDYLNWLLRQLFRSLRAA